MRRPNKGAGGSSLCVLIPARNEEENLRRLVPALVSQGVRVYIFDDESTDGTARVARDGGAVVISPR
ncbi:glycosyltransferase, partial [Acinetobacter baumannii]